MVHFVGTAEMGVGVATPSPPERTGVVGDEDPDASSATRSLACESALGRRCGRADVCGPIVSVVDGRSGCRAGSRLPAGCRSVPCDMKVEWMLESESRSAFNDL